MDAAPAPSGAALHSPPLTYWAVAASIATFGHNEWAARLPNAAAWVGTVLLVFALARHLAPERELLAAVIQATSLLPFVAMNIVTTDTLLTFCELLGAYGFVRFRWAVAARPERSEVGPLLDVTGFRSRLPDQGAPGLLPRGDPSVVATEGARGLARLETQRDRRLPGARLRLVRGPDRRPPAAPRLLSDRRSSAG
ncbi:MAG: glycosyltransferase family 39 protein [Thermoanaerobaculia bacterium]